MYTYVHVFVRTDMFLNVYAHEQVRSFTGTDVFMYRYRFVHVQVLIIEQLTEEKLSIYQYQSMKLNYRTDIDTRKYYQVPTSDFYFLRLCGNLYHISRTKYVSRWRKNSTKTAVFCSRFLMSQDCTTSRVTDIGHTKNDNLLLDICHRKT